MAGPWWSLRCCCEPSVLCPNCNCICEPIPGQGYPVPCCFTLYFDGPGIGTFKLIAYTVALSTSCEYTVGNFPGQQLPACDLRGIFRVAGGNLYYETPGGSVWTGTIPSGNPCDALGITLTLQTAGTENCDVTGSTIIAECDTECLGTGCAYCNIWLGGLALEGGYSCEQYQYCDSPLNEIRARHDWAGAYYMPYDNTQFGWPWQGEYNGTRTLLQTEECCDWQGQNYCLLENCHVRVSAIQYCSPQGAQSWQASVALNWGEVGDPYAQRVALAAYEKLAGPNNIFPKPDCFDRDAVDGAITLDRTQLTIDDPYANPILPTTVKLLKA